MEFSWNKNSGPSPCTCDGDAVEAKNWLGSCSHTMMGGLGLNWYAAAVWSSDKQCGQRGIDFAPPVNASL